MTVLKPIRTEADHAAALQEIAALMDAEPGDPDRLELLAVLVAEYERRTFEDPPEPADVLEVAMQVQGRTQAELSTVLGSRARASEVLARRRGLSSEMAGRVAVAWGLPLRLLGGAPEAGKARGRAAATAAVVALVLGLAGAGGFLAALNDLPDIAPVVEAAAPAAGEALTRDLPPHVYQAVLSAQDADFFAHAGYDGAAIVRAAGRNLAPSSWSRPQGAATLTQQLAKTVLLRGEPKGLRRKVREIVLARQIERRLSKEQILDAGLNAAYFGGGATGLSHAAQRYFGKSAQDLSVAEAAYLAALPNAPKRLRLDVPANHERARESRNRVLERMVLHGYLTPTAAQALTSASIS